MNKFYLTGAAAVAVLMSAAPAVAAPNLIVNGGFQTGYSANGGFSTIFSPSVASPTSAIPFWSVTSGSVDLITGYWQGANSTFASIDIKGNSNGTISQTIATDIGKIYRLVFFKSANPDNFANIDRVVQVSVTGNAAKNFTYDGGQGQTRTDMKWQKTGMLFKATGLSTIVSFSALDPTGGPSNCCWGLALDGVSVTATPEPEAVASIFVGLGLAGFVARRRRAKAALVAA